MGETGIVLLTSTVLIILLVLIIKSSNASEKKKMSIICPNPNCGYRGIGEKDGGTSGCLVFVLLCAGILPGILYLMFAGKPGVKCPHCGMKVR